MKRLTSILLQRGLVSQDAIDAAKPLAHTASIGLGKALVRSGALTEEQLIDALSAATGARVLTASNTPKAEDVRAAALRLGLPLKWLVDNGVIVWATNDNCICVAGPDVLDPWIQETVGQWPARVSSVQLASSIQLEPILLAFRAEGASPDIGDVNDASRLAAMALDAPVVDFVNAVLAEAASRAASDIHIEPFEDKVVVRMRIDGVLSQRRLAPRQMFDAIASRIKLLSGMDIAERRLPQDGRQSVRIGVRDFDVRVSSLPTAWGESIVVRLLGKSAQIPELDALGLDPAQKQVLLDAIARPHGLMLVSGPTGSGKTTTVYRLLTELNDGVRKIVTIEDPVEFHLPGVLQTRVRADIGLDFARGLRSILRQDPDVIFVGEIRDAETARTAVQAAMTGHLVISTLHTNSALSAISRMVDLGVEPFLLADVLRSVVAQRLLRSTCRSCARAASDTATLDARFATLMPGIVPAAGARWMEGSGCEACSGSGFLGRKAVFEAIRVDASLQELVRGRAPHPQLLALARRSGAASMRQGALMRARSGETTLQEALRVIDMDDA